MKSNQCKQCGAKFVRFPLLKGPLWEGESWNSKLLLKNINWINMFKMDMMSLTFLIVIIFMVWGYKIDMQQYEDIRNDPYGFCKDVCIRQIDNSTPKQILDLSNFNLSQEISTTNK